MSSEPTATRARSKPLVGFALGLLLGSILVIALSYVSDERYQAEESGSAATSEELSQVASIAPNPEWLPREVVQRQVEAMIASNSDPTAIADCFALASPSNRLVTGPLERFAAMVAGPNYRPLLEARTFSVGEAIVQDRYAAVLVTLMTYQDEPYAFRFFLSQQTGETTNGKSNSISQFEDCWLTDGVTRVSPPLTSPLLEGPSA